MVIIFRTENPARVYVTEKKKRTSFAGAERADGSYITRATCRPRAQFDVSTYSVFLFSFSFYYYYSLLRASDVRRESNSNFHVAARRDNIYFTSFAAFVDGINTDFILPSASFNQNNMSRRRRFVCFCIRDHRRSIHRRLVYRLQSNCCKRCRR